MSAAAKHIGALQHAVRSATSTANDAPSNTLTAAFKAVKDATKARDKSSNNPAKYHASKTASQNDAPPRSSSPKLLGFLFEPHAKPINYTTFQATKAIADDPSHPFYIRTQRRLAAFDPSKLHWRVQVPYDVSKKAALRNWAKKRVMRAFAGELEKRGYEKDGAVKEGADKKSVSGALLIILSKDSKLALGFKDEEMQGELSHVLSKVVERQGPGQSRGRTSYQRKQRPGHGREASADMPRNKAKLDSR